MAAIEAKGRDGTVTFDGQWLTITRSGWTAGLRGGRGDIRLHIGQVTGVELKKPGMSAGRFTVIAPGTQQSRPGARGHQDNPLSVLIGLNGMDQFRALRDAVEQAIGQRMQQQAPAPAGPDMAGQLAQLAQLHAQGVLDDAEFAAAKARLIG